MSLPSSPITETMNSQNLNNSNISDIKPRTISVDLSNSSNSEVTHLTTSLVNSLDLQTSDCSVVKENQQLKNKFEIFEKCFASLTKIQENQKIWIEDDIMMIDHSPYYSLFLVQSFNRYMNNQGRDHLFTYIDEKFTEYMQYLDKVKEKIHWDSDDKLIKKTAQDNITLISNIIPGLHTLKQSYMDCDKLVMKISSIILTFIDFKDFIESQFSKKV